MGHNSISHNHSSFHNLPEEHSQQHHTGFLNDNPLEFLFSGIAHTGDESTYEKSDISDLYSHEKQSQDNYDFLLTDHFDGKLRQKEFVYYLFWENEHLSILSKLQSTDFLRGPPSPRI